jgi:hypothetical protein
MVGRLAFFENGGKIAEAIPVGRVVCKVEKQVADCLACRLS